MSHVHSKTVFQKRSRTWVVNWIADNQIGRDAHENGFDLFQECSISRGGVFIHRGHRTVNNLDVRLMLFMNSSSFPLFHPVTTWR